MAGRGNTIPKPDGTTRRKDKPKATVVAEDGELRGPELPYGFDWPAPTREWWESWRRSPQAQTFTQTDWDFLMDTALLHAELWAGNAAVAPELRLRVSKMGATPEDRARLRIQIGEVEQSPARSASSASERRQRLKVV